jgi:hypothetical protein
MLKTILLPVAFFLASQVTAEAGHGFGRDEAREWAAKWLKENTAFIRCDGQHFIYGIAYIDGSYMERIFYVRGGGDQPELSVSFRDGGIFGIEGEEEFGPIPFVLEMKFAEALYATPSNGGWRVSDDGWEAALRFKYTSWFGTISMQGGEWRVKWQGYRRPMLPPGLTEHAGQLCSMFAGR